MKKLVTASLIALLALTACKKEPAEQADTKPEPAVAVPAESAEPVPAEAEETHEHEHHAGDPYQCDNNKAVTFVVHDHEGETEAHAVIDDIEYDLTPAEGAENTFVAEADGIDGKPMKAIKEGDKLTFKSVDDKAVLLSCTALPADQAPHTDAHHEEHKSETTPETKSDDKK